jgi:glycosyltransferase involved in cell wall biosynthesis
LSKGILKMKIAFFTHYKELYGANRSLINLMQGLKGYACEPFLIAPYEGDITDCIRQQGVPVKIIPFPYWYSKISGTGNQAEVFQDAVLRTQQIIELLPIVTEVLSEWGVDLIYSNSSVINIGILAAQKLKKPHVWHIREYGDLDYDLYVDTSRLLHREIMRCSDGVIFVSHALRKHILGATIHSNAGVIYNGVASADDIIKMSRERSYERKNSHFIFSLVGVINQNKGQDIAIRALAHVVKYFPNIKLRIAGGGDTGYLEKLASNLSVTNNVDFLGMISDPFRLFLNTDIALICSRHEAMGRVTAEAMTCGCPVIGFNNGGTAELIDDGNTGFLYDNGPEELAEKMIVFLRQPSFVEKMGRHASQFAQKTFSIERYANNVFNVIKKSAKLYSSNIHTVQPFDEYFEQYGQMATNICV